MRWKHSSEFITSGMGGYILEVDQDRDQGSNCVFTLRIDSVDQSHEGTYRCELDGVNNEDPPISAERTLRIARKSGCPSGLSVCPSVSLVKKYFQSSTQSLY